MSPLTFINRAMPKFYVPSHKRWYCTRCGRQVPQLDDNCSMCSSLRQSLAYWRERGVDDKGLIDAAE